MDIVFHAFGMPFNGETVKSKSLGGSESAAYYLARELARRGHRVKVFTNSQDEGTWDGVAYHWLGEATADCPWGQRFYHYAKHTPHDALVVQRSQKAFATRWASKVNVWQLHDLALHRTSPSIHDMTPNIDVVTCVSEFHAKQVESVWPINRKVLRVVPNGIDPELYQGPITLNDDLAKCVNDARDMGGLLMLYQSRPERGLEHLLRPGGIMERLAAQGSQAKLVICGYSNTVPQMVAYYEQLAAWGNRLPNVVDVGPLAKPDLAALQRSCDLLIYPTEFEEVSCITAMEAMAAGLPMLTSAHAALPETCEGSGTILLPLKDGRADEDAFYETILRLEADLGDPDRIEATELGKLKLGQVSAALGKTWAKAADRLEATIEEAFEGASLAAKVRHCVRHSDIEAARWLLKDRPTDGDNAIVTKARHELESMFAFTESDEAYAAHYEKHGNEYYDKFGFEALREDATGTSRWRATWAQLLKALADPEKEGEVRREFRLLDYGCAHGHYSIPLAKRFPMASFMGLDINAKAIQAATEWAKAENIGHLEFRLGSEADLDRDKVGRFDVILAGEVLEHVRDYRRLLERLRGLLTPTGCIIITTPFGPWEWIGHEAFKTGREHLHHFERADLDELFAGMDFDVLCAPVNPCETGEPVGSWVTRVRPGTLPFGELDYTRKFGHLKPRETVSACLIVKNGERSLRKALDSVADHVDEVLIGVDEGTTDETMAVIGSFIKSNPWLPVQAWTIKSPLEVGFDTARNGVHDRACGDWILWFDADEECVNAWDFNALLRRNQHDGYNVSQVHFAAQPAQVLSTDFPCRIYRNRAGIRMYGVVHEHPETAVGEAIGTSAIRAGIQFCHNGYMTEAVRRGRYQRNLPLLMRDRERYPNRMLNQFLYLRDVAQGLSFEIQQSQGNILEGHRERAQQVVDLWFGLLQSEKPVTRLLVDALPYYSTAVELLGGGFEAGVTMATRKDNLQAATEVKGKFLKRDHFETLVKRLMMEATQFYESPYF